MIAVVDYGMGNLRSVAKALELSGAEVAVSGSPKDILAADSVVLPGVGAFSKGMENLHKLGLVSAVLDAVKKGKPFLGICLGMQLMFEKSEEGAGCPGLGVLKGGVGRFPPGLRVPHVGWNIVSCPSRAGLFEGLPRENYFYFVHSYFARPGAGEIVVASSTYGIEFAAAVKCGNMHLVQFHPEKSRESGMKLLANFRRLTERKASC